jgi:hypothetical protein
MISLNPVIAFLDFVERDGCCYACGWAPSRRLQKVRRGYGVLIDRTCIVHDFSTLDGTESSDHDQ